MIPNCGPAPTDSRAEQLVYHLLQDQLEDGFTVIHSLPWLSAAVREIAGVKAVTGEIDFLIVHPSLGVLAVEVKGGAHKVQGLAFVHVTSGATTRAVEQVRTSTHGLARWLGVKPGLRLKIGYALIFPDSDFNGQIASLALTDVTVDPPESIVIDRANLPGIGQRIVEIMTYWKTALANPPLGEERRKALINTICPSFDGTPSWAARVVWDEQVWLRLTPEQSAVVDDAIMGNRKVITGWPGTGKTLILIESARRLLDEGKRVLVLTFNTLLAQYIRNQIGSNKLLKVGTWHSLCASTAARSRQDGGETDTSWLEDGCLEDIRNAVSRGKIQPFDAVLIDEAQTFRAEWLEWLCGWHSEGQMLAFCDETQVFAFEQGRVSLPRLCELVGVAKPFALTTVLRSPKAVYQRLKSVKESDYQLHMPRELEVDTLKEVLVVGMLESLSQTLVMLAEKGIPDSDIVVLSKFGRLEGDGKSAAQRHTLSRFRGMESPVVVICSAEEMDDAELFCAYSRATTLCIALYDAEFLGVKGARCLFQATVMAEPGNVEQASDARLKAQTGEIIRADLSPRWFDLQSVEIGWLREWGAWLVVVQNELSLYWIDYIASHYPWPIYYWYESSLREIQRGSPVSNPVEDGPGGMPHRLRACGVCSIVTPQRLSPLSSDDVWQCSICSRDEETVPDCPDDRMIDEIRVLDSLVNVENPKSLSDVERKSLPLSLAAGAALSLAERDLTRDLVGFDQISGGRIAYHAALGFVYSLVNLLPPGKNIRVADMARELYGRYLVPKELTYEVWKRDFAQACGVAYKREHLRKIEKGVYTPNST
ncbi:NERD domain-containing protein/DEAD/DEAH box helicase [Luteimonas sp. BDR2-5]|uniref:nuclease-related domain-containing DEAD/DEAH box helicase n=1 Tax=Proluteimonas luteida TaxID=2878685 RepID=UPI001E43720F|nr:NERD domain-containing protein/DEAD/DEAH box helicase [Luteimonas sp. BDR2-5]MCD9026604.1 NERD domain-containing protein/DEAD/DEAH box helicase [Luteimonas sp. BDR2-5]